MKYIFVNVKKIKQKTIILLRKLPVKVKTNFCYEIVLVKTKKQERQFFCETQKKVKTFLKTFCKGKHFFNYFVN